MKLNELKQTYKGGVADTYESNRVIEPKWKKEQEVIHEILKKISNKEKNMSLLDVPVGTGRFFEIYKTLGFKATGADISKDMLKQAKEKSINLNFPVKLRIDDITRLKLEKNSYDVSLCIRLFNWLNKKNLEKALKQLTKVSKKHVIIGVRTYGKNLTLKKKSLNLFERAKKMYRKGYITVHNEKHLLKIFSSNNLKIKEKILIDSKENRTFYHIYYLTKN